jgi:glycosyltransferase involved in cell wall biosynthesis
MKFKVLISYHYFAHYRLPILKELANDPDIDFTFISGITTNKKIKLIDRLDFKNNGINWVEITNIWFAKKKLLWQKSLIKHCISGEYDSIILLGNPYSITNWIVAILLKIIGKPFYFWAHAIIRNQKRDKIKVHFYKLANGLFLYGNWSKNRLLEFGFKEEKLHVIYNSLDYKNQLKIRNNLDLDQIKKFRFSALKNNNLPTLLFIGRLIPDKKLDLLILAMSKLVEKNKKINLIIVGDGEARKELNDLVDNLKLNDFIFFYGETYNEEEIALLFMNSSICVSPGEIGLTGIHSLTYGTPVITHNNPYKQGPEFEAIIDGENGMFFKEDSVESLVEVIQYWLEKKLSKIEENRVNCYKIIDEFYNPTYQRKIINKVLLTK